MAEKRNLKNVLKDFFSESHFKGFYFFVFGAFVLLFFIILVKSGGASLKGALFSDTSDTFMDHYNSMVYNEIDDPYTNRVIYPPLASFLYRLCNIAVPGDDYYSLVTDPYVLAQSRFLRVNQSFVFQFIIYAVIAMLIFLAALCLLKKGSSWEKALFVGATMVSLPFLYMADRGNNILLPVAFSIFFVVLYDHKNKILRELGLISLAVAVGLKIYPLAFLVFFVADKKYKELGRELIYIFGTLILPFFIFYDGIASMKLMLGNLFGFSSKRTTETNLSGQLDFKRIFYFLHGCFRQYTGITIAEGKREIYANIFRYGLSAVCGLGALFTKKMWKRTALIAAVIFGFPGSASTYSLLFMVIPLALFLDEEKKPGLENYIYLSFFVLINIPLLMKQGTAYTRYWPTKLESFAVAGIVFFAFVDMISDFAAWDVDRKRENRPFLKAAGSDLLYRFIINRKTPAAAGAGGPAPAAPLPVSETGSLPEEGGAANEK